MKQSEEHQPTTNKESPIKKNNENTNKEVLLISPSNSDEIDLDKENNPNENETKKTDENKEITNIKDNNSKEGKKINPTPNIFTERECTTCLITRPPTASHCSICGNCVLGFDQ